VLEREISFGLYIGRVRDKRGLSLRVASRKIGVSFSRLGEWERGTDSHTGKPVVPPRHAVSDIARAYGVPADELLAMAGYRSDRDPSPQEERLLAAFRRLSAEVREAVIVDVEARFGGPL
jgi:transcriptional regulator with XRE-family HTH domain